jgi:mRNA interferase MazF
MKNSLYKQGDIVLIPFPFSNLRSVKTRPGLIISNSLLGGDDMIVLGITSQKKLGHHVKVQNKNLSEGKLPVDSYIKIGKVVSLNKGLIRTRVAKLCDATMFQVIEEHKKVIEINT